ncbi:MAG: penicillin-binding protein 2 [Candidatus Krumholzibacteriia bacterium]
MFADRPQRARVFRIAVVAIFGIIITNLFVLQVVRHNELKARSVENRQVRTRVRPPRGRLLDRDGRVLADNVYVADITVGPGSLRRRGKVAPDSTLDRLITWLELPRAETLARMQRDFQRGQDRLTVVPGATMRQIAAVEERRAQLPGARVEARSRRRYLYGSMLAHVTGYVSEVTQAEMDSARPAGVYAPGDLVGKSGLEAGLEARLRGRAGTRIEEVNAAGRVVGREAVWLEPVTAGEDLRLSLSLALQETLAAAMAGRPGGAVAMAVPSGEVLAAYSSPSYDPNLFVGGISSDDWRQLRDDPDRPLFNRIMQATYPPGSPYKVVTSLCGLLNGAVGPHGTFQPCGGGYQYGSRFFRCWKKEGHGWVDHELALVKSCDTFYYQLGLHLNIDQMQQTALALHLGRPTGVPFRNEAGGLIPSSAWYDKHYGKRGWTRAVMLNNAIGQGEVLVTPLQMAMLTATVASSGRVDRPHFLAGEPHGRPAPLPFPEDQLAWVRGAMARVVEEGTGTAARVEGYRVAGKTGTAQNSQGGDHAWFICYAPVEAPEVAMAVIIEHGGHGGSVAAPVTARWLKAYFAGRAAADSAAVAAGPGASPPPAESGGGQ